MLYLTELLYFLAYDGKTTAKQAFRHQYEKLYTNLSKIERHPAFKSSRPEQYSYPCQSPQIPASYR